MNIHEMLNIDYKPTSFKTDNNIILDVILTSNRKRITGSLKVDTGISYFHNFS